MIFSGLLEASGYLILIPLLDSIFYNSNIFDSRLISFINHFIDLGVRSKSDILKILIFIFVLKGILTFIILNLFSKYKSILMKKLKLELYYKFIDLNYLDFLKKDIGKITNLITSQVDRSIFCFHHLSLVYLNVSLLIIILIFLLFSLGYVSIYLILIILCIGILFKKMNLKMQFYSKESAQIDTQIAKNINDTFSSFKYLIFSGKKSYFSSNLKKLISSYSFFELKKWTLSNLLIAVREPMAVIFITVLIFLFQAFNFSLTYNILSILLFYRAFNMALTVQKSWQSCTAFTGSFEYVDKSLHLHINQQKKIDNSNKIKINNINDIVLENLSFQYDKNIQIFQGLTFKFEKEKFYLIKSKSGLGKTTLLDLIMNLIKPTNGVISFNNTNYENIENKIFENKIGYVQQSPVVFDGSILFNLFLNENRIEELSSKEHLYLNQLLDSLDLKNFIDSLNNGLETNLGENGIKLSGGQLQRINLVRELLKKPEILILDEPTSSLDDYNSNLIYKLIRSYKGKMTILLVTHSKVFENLADFKLSIQSKKLFLEKV